MVISHRGKNTGAPENTLAAFENALTLGADGIECDLRLTRDHHVVVHHDYTIRHNGRRVLVSRIGLPELQRAGGNGAERLLTLDELLSFVRERRIEAFLEVKSASPHLAEAVCAALKAHDLWGQVHIIGFSIFIKTALALQRKYPGLRVVPLLNMPAFAYVKMPPRSYGVFVGWIDGMIGSERIFKLTTPRGRLAQLREHYEKQGVKVFAGVINRLDDLRAFREAGYPLVVTDNVLAAKSVFRAS